MCLSAKLGANIYYCGLHAVDNVSVLSTPDVFVVAVGNVTMGIVIKFMVLFAIGDIIHIRVQEN